MKLGEKLIGELKSVAGVALYFAVWIGGLLILKELILAEYSIEFHRLSMALVGALVLAKVVLVLEHVPLGSWVEAQPALVDLVLRTGLYSIGTFVVLLLEHGFEGRHEHDGLGPSLMAVFQQADVDHVLANAICLGSALLGFNAVSVVRRDLGPGGLRRLFLSPPLHGPVGTSASGAVRPPNQ